MATEPQLRSSECTAFWIAALTECCTLHATNRWEKKEFQKRTEAKTARQEKRSAARITDASGLVVDIESYDERLSVEADNGFQRFAASQRPKTISISGD